jgi:hypothetical protein
VINDAFRFILEIVAMVVLGMWGWRQGSGALRFVLGLGVPLVAAVLWGTFRVPDDPGPAPVPVPGVVRLGLEAVVFGFAVWALRDLDKRLLAAIMAGALILHYAVAYKRIAWLVKR